MADGHTGEGVRGSRDGSPALSDMSRDSLDMDMDQSESQVLQQPRVEGGDSLDRDEDGMAADAMEVQLTGEVEHETEQSDRATPTDNQDGSWAREIDALDRGEADTDASEEEEVHSGSVSDGARSRTPSESGRGRGRPRRRRNKGPRRTRAPPCQRPPRDGDIRRFLSDVFTQTSLPGDVHEW